MGMGAHSIFNPIFLHPFVLTIKNQCGLLCTGHGNHDWHFIYTFFVILAIVL